MQNIRDVISYLYFNQCRSGQTKMQLTSTIYQGPPANCVISYNALRNNALAASDHGSLPTPKAMLPLERTSNKNVMVQR